ncbi:ubiquitin C-terminal hydrolase 12 [Capsicum chacoense]
MREYMSYSPYFIEVNKENSTDASPARYLMKIESFSSLSENGFLKYESNEFESCGYKWKMIIHPVGDGEGHISLYLAIVGTSSLHADWEVNASFSFLIFDQIHDNYTVMKGNFCYIIL